MFEKSSISLEASVMLSESSSYREETSQVSTPKQSPRFRYAIISPMKDEEAYAAQTIESVLAQTVRPIRWVLVDDASRDRTHEITSGYANQNDWIIQERIERDPIRNPGPAVVVAFNAGLKHLDGVDYDFLVKLDMDLILPPDYFENLLARFEKDKKLGIASGVYLEFSDNQWSAIQMPAYHAAGASKVMRRQCFEGIGGYCTDVGWDTIDEIRARARGWNTRHFDDLQFKHLRPEGRGVGLLRNCRKLGVAHYLMGGGFIFLLFKIPYRMLTAKPRILGGLAMLWGYLSCIFSGRRPLVTEEEGMFYRDLLHSRLWGWWRKAPTETVASPDRPVS
jgi:biofilm PGA synthesis N-glycosyltransferase PgaC